MRISEGVFESSGKFTLFNLFKHAVIRHISNVLSTELVPPVDYLSDANDTFVVAHWTYRFFENATRGRARRPGVG